MRFGWTVPHSWGGSLSTHSIAHEAVTLAGQPIHWRPGFGLGPAKIGRYDWGAIVATPPPSQFAETIIDDTFYDSMSLQSAKQLRVVQSTAARFEDVQGWLEAGGMFGCQLRSN